MIDPAAMRRAVNGIGFDVQRLTATGWTAINGLPLATWELAVAYMACCDPADGSEYRIYEALRPRT